jgi:general secretion pathway protein L
MLNTLYILLPSRAVALARGDWAADAYPFALTSAEGTIQQQGVRSPRELQEYVRQARQVVLLPAASDVSLLRVKTPPLPAAKLKAVLPNLVEDQLMGDPADAVLIAGVAQDGERTVAAIDKAWLESAVRPMLELGARKVAAVPLQLGLEWGEGSASVLLTEDQGAVELALRTAPQAGLGLSLAPDGADAHGVAAQVVQMLNLFVPEGKLVLYAPALEQATYQEACKAAGAGDTESRIEVRQASWQSRIAGLGDLSMDLVAGLQLPGMADRDLRAWRWPVVLAVLVLLVNAAALNIEWFSLKREAQRLSDSLVQSFRAAYPKENVVRAPLEQMQQKIAMSRRLAGQSSPDDFIILAAQFAQAWDRAGLAQAGVSVQSLEYRERGLAVKTKSSNPLPLDQIRSALTEQSLNLVSSNDGVLQVRPLDRTEK